MKKITTLLFVMLGVTSAFAHELPLPHAHDSYVHGFGNFIMFVAVPLLIIYAIFKLIRKSSKA